MAPHSSTLAWKIPRTGEPGRLQSMGSLRVGHDWATSLSLSCIGEGNGNPLQCSCLENPRDGGAWWAAVYGVAQSRTRLKRLSSSSSSSRSLTFNVIKVAEFWSTILLLSVHFLWSTFLMLSGLFENLFSISLYFTYWPLLRPYLYFLMIILRIFIYPPILCLFR